MSALTASTAPTASFLRSCPRCHGYLFHAQDQYGGYSSCVCCGFVQEWTCGPAIKLPTDPPAEGRRRRRAPSHQKRAL